jgi:hypothetical protein
MYNHFTHRLSKPAARLIRLPLLLALVLASPAHSETGTAADTEAIKYEAIELISRLHRLEKDLLYPVHTQVSVFVSVADNSQARPHSVSIDIDGSTVSDHIYTQEEISALNAGGIQRLYTGNTLQGNHKLRVRFRQARKDGNVQTNEFEYKFNKDENAENIEIIVDSQKPYYMIKSRN